MTLLKSIFSTLLDFLYPPTCIICENLLESGREKICPACWKSLPRVTRDTILYQETRERLRKSGLIADVVACFIFEKDGPFQHVAHALKYQGLTSIGFVLGTAIGRTMIEWDITADVIVPVPLHSLRQRERGFNQSELIAKGISTIIHKPVDGNILKRRRNTPSQTKLNAAEREQNLSGAFELHAGRLTDVRAKSFLLVDDVITTGATTLACAREFMRAGAASVTASSAALAQ